MEQIYKILLGVCITALCSAAFLILRQFSICGRLLINLLEWCCVPERHIEGSHLDTHHLRVHYAPSRDQVYIDGLPGKEPSLADGEESLKNSLECDNEGYTECTGREAIEVRTQPRVEVRPQPRFEALSLEERNNYRVSSVRSNSQRIV